MISELTQAVRRLAQLRYKHAPYRTKIELDFALTDEGELIKEYTAVYEKSNTTQNEYFSFAFEEMAECFVNGELCKVKFWGREFEVGRLLKKGKNEIRIVVTDNIANKYSKNEMKCTKQS